LFVCYIYHRKLDYKSVLGLFQTAECVGHQILKSGRKAEQPGEEEGGAKDEEEEGDEEARSLFII
jgi:hypothetical protein